MGSLKSEATNRDTQTHNRYPSTQSPIFIFPTLPIISLSPPLFFSPRTGASPSHRRTRLSLSPPPPLASPVTGDREDKEEGRLSRRQHSPPPLFLPLSHRHHRHPPRPPPSRHRRHPPQLSLFGGGRENDEEDRRGRRSFIGKGDEDSRGSTASVLDPSLPLLAAARRRSPLSPLSLSLSRRCYFRPQLKTSIDI